MNNVLFSIYTLKSGHQVMGFQPFDAAGRDAFQQVKDYARETYNDPQDKPRIFVLNEIPAS